MIWRFRKSVINYYAMQIIYFTMEFFMKIHGQILGNKTDYFFLGVLESKLPNTCRKIDSFIFREIVNVLTVRMWNNKNNNSISSVNISDIYTERIFKTYSFVYIIGNWNSLVLADYWHFTSDNNCIKVIVWYSVYRSKYFQFCHWTITPKCDISDIISHFSLHSLFLSSQ